MNRVYSLHLTYIIWLIFVGRTNDVQTWLAHHISEAFLSFQGSQSHRRMPLSLNQLGWPKVGTRRWGTCHLSLNTSPVSLLHASSSVLVRVQGSLSVGHIDPGEAKKKPKTIRGGQGSSEEPRKLASLLGERGYELSVYVWRGSLLQPQWGC